MAYSKQQVVDSSYILVAAIDFGTTFSGYTFSFKSNQDKIMINKSWGAELGFQSYKTPTTVLTSPDGGLKSFGFEAEHEYSNLDENQLSPDKYNLYQRFKMNLHGEEGMKKKMLIHSTNGNIRPAKEIFAMALLYLKDHLIGALKLTLATSPKMREICWVLTVPAIWGDAAKRFMREAACEAGMIDYVDSNKLIIALEPEAASLYCRTLDWKQFLGMESQQGALNMEPGTKYMVIDAGGGTVDITVHHLNEDGTVKELYAATGGAWGGSYVDAKYQTLLDDLFGGGFMKHFKNTCPSQWLNMMIEFEKKKRAAKPDSTSSTNLSISMAFAKQYEKYTGKEIESAFEDKPRLGVKFSSSGMMCILQEKIKELFHEIIEKILNHLKYLVRNQAVKRVSHVFLVGGFAECPYLQESIQNFFGNRCVVLIPEEPSLCVMKGATLYGHAPKSIKSRVTRYTYAVDTTHAYTEGQHDPERKELKRGRYRVHILKTFIRIHSEIATGAEKKHVLHPSHPDQTKVGFTLYASKKEEIQYPDEPDIIKLAKITVDSPDKTKGKKRNIIVSVTFGGTEITFQAIDEETGNEAKALVSYDI